MADDSKIRVKPRTDSPAAAPAPAVAPVKLPELDDAPAYREAVANLNRLKHEERDIERRLGDARAACEAARADQHGAVAAVLAGAKPGEVRRDTRQNDAAIEAVYADLKLTRRAILLAEKEVVECGSRVKEQVVAPLAASYKAALRKTALAWLSYAGEAAKLDEVNEHLKQRGMYGYAGCESPLPDFRGGDIRDEQSATALAIRDLLAAGVLDRVTDADVLAGFAVAPPRQVFTEPAPKTNEKKPGKLARALRAVNEAFAHDNW